LKGGRGGTKSREGSPFLSTSSTETGKREKKGWKKGKKEVGRRKSRRGEPHFGELPPEDVLVDDIARSREGEREGKGEGRFLASTIVNAVVDNAQHEGKKKRKKKKKGTGEGRKALSFSPTPDRKEGGEKEEIFF